jgi:hypothetical protein
MNEAPDGATIMIIKAFQNRNLEESPGFPKNPYVFAQTWGIGNLESFGVSSCFIIIMILK